MNLQEQWAIDLNSIIPVGYYYNGGMCYGNGSLWLTIRNTSGNIKVQRLDGFASDSSLVTTLDVGSVGAVYGTNVGPAFDRVEDNLAILKRTVGIDFYSLNGAFINRQNLPLIGAYHFSPIITISDDGTKISCTSSYTDTTYVGSLSYAAGSYTVSWGLATYTENDPIAALWRPRHSSFRTNDLSIVADATPDRLDVFSGITDTILDTQQPFIIDAGGTHHSYNAFCWINNRYLACYHDTNIVTIYSDEDYLYTESGVTIPCCTIIPRTFAPTTELPGAQAIPRFKTCCDFKGQMMIGNLF